MSTKAGRLAGLKKVQANFDKALKEVQGYTAEALTDVVLDLCGKAVLLAPVETGDLRGSGKAEIDKVLIATGNGDGSLSVVGDGVEMVKLREHVSGTVSFSTPYAVRQHEELEYNHPQGGQAKYLEQPFKENTPRYIKHLADSVKKAVD
jgi:hypothetical protein